MGAHRCGRQRPQVSTLVEEVTKVGHGVLKVWDVVVLFVDGGGEGSTCKDRKRELKGVLGWPATKASGVVPFQAGDPHTPLTGLCFFLHCAADIADLLFFSNPEIHPL